MHSIPAHCSRSSGEWGDLSESTFPDNWSFAFKISKHVFEWFLIKIFLELTYSRCVRYTKQSLTYLQLSRDNNDYSMARQKNSIGATQVKAHDVLLHSGVLGAFWGFSAHLGTRLPPPSRISCYFEVLSNCPPLMIFNLLIYSSHNIMGKILRLAPFSFPSCF